MRALPFLFFLFIGFNAFSQGWDENGDNQSTGNLTVGSVNTTLPYGVNLAPDGSSDAVIRRTTSGSLMISSGGGSSQVRFNYNYGGGSGGISIFDGGTSNHAGLTVNSSGHLTIAPSGSLASLQGNLFLGTNELQFLSASGGNNRIQSFGGSGIFGTWLFKSRFDHIVFDAGENTGNERSILFNTGGTERLRLDTYGNLGINKHNPDTKLDLNGTFQIYPAGNAGGSGALKLRVLAGSSASIIEANSDMVWADHDIIINSASTSGANLNQLVLHNTGNIGIGTSAPDAKLTVKGDIHSTEVRVDLSGSVAPDYVFDPNYQLLPLTELEGYLKRNKHLPEVPSAKQMDVDGLKLKEMNLLLLKKVEELTLYLIELKKENELLMDRVTRLESK